MQNPTSPMPAVETQNEERVPRTLNNTSSSKGAPRTPKNVRRRCTRLPSLVGQSVLPHQNQNEAPPVAPSPIASTCAICLEVPHDPVRLPCRHKFCRMCVTALRAHTCAGKKVPGSKCPLCRTMLPPSPLELQAMYLKATKQAILASRIYGQDLRSLRLRSKLRKEARLTFQTNKLTPIDQILGPTRRLSLSDEGERE